MTQIRRRRADQNAAFLAALARTGNAREAARRLGVHRGTYFKRRARDPAFAAAWHAALDRFNSSPAFAGEGDRPKPGGGASPGRDGQPRTMVLTRLRNGRAQLRRAAPGRITPAAEAAFLTALAASANVRLSAAAAGFTHSSFYHRARKSRAFAREMRLALDQGYEAVRLALLQAGLPEEQHGADWRLGGNDPPPVPPMTAAQALQLLHLHRNTVELGWSRPHRRKRRGESDETYRQRLMVMWVAEKRMEAEDEAIRQALQNPPPVFRGRGTMRSMVEGPREARTDAPILPSLDQVTGWSKAKPPVPSGDEGPHNPDLALFGGWRITDWKA